MLVTNAIAGRLLLVSTLLLASSLASGSAARADIDLHTVVYAGDAEPQPRPGAYCHGGVTGPRAFPGLPVSMAVPPNVGGAGKTLRLDPEYTSQMDSTFHRQVDSCAELVTTLPTTGVGSASAP